MFSDSTLATVPVNRSVQAWLTLHAALIRRIAATLNVPATAVAAPLMQESGGIIFDADTPASMFLTPVIDDPLKPDSLGSYQEQPVDQWLDGRMQHYSHQDIAQDYIDKQAEIAGAPDAVRSGPGRWIEKYFSPTANDLGWGNVNLETAIHVLDNYLADPQYAGDPLHLKHYRNDYKALALDLVDPHGEASFAISGLVARQAQSYFVETYGDAYERPPEPAKAALTTTYFKQGDAAIRQHLVDPIAPALPDPMHGDGGPDILDNANWGTLLKSPGVPPNRPFEHHADAGPAASSLAAALPIRDPAPWAAGGAWSDPDLNAGDDSFGEAPAIAPLPLVSFQADAPHIAGGTPQLSNVGKVPAAFGALPAGRATDGASMPARDQGADDDPTAPPGLAEAFGPRLPVDAAAASFGTTDFSRMPEIGRGPELPSGDASLAGQFAGAGQAVERVPNWIGNAGSLAEPAIPPDWARPGPTPSGPQADVPTTLPETRSIPAGLGPPLASAGFAPRLFGSAEAPGGSVAPVGQGPGVGAGWQVPPMPDGADGLQDLARTPDLKPRGADAVPAGWPSAAGSAPFGDTIDRSLGSAPSAADGRLALGEIPRSKEDERDASSPDAPAWTSRTRSGVSSNRRSNADSDGGGGAAAPKEGGAAPAATGGAQAALPGSATRPMEVELDSHLLGTVVASALERSAGGPNTGPASVNSSQIYTPAGVNISGLQ
jgi:hypothetical protein